MQTSPGSFSAILMLHIDTFMNLVDYAHRLAAIKSNSEAEEGDTAKMLPIYKAIVRQTNDSNNLVSLATKTTASSRRKTVLY